MVREWAKEIEKVREWGKEIERSKDKEGAYGGCSKSGISQWPLITGSRERVFPQPTWLSTLFTPKRAGGGGAHGKLFVSE